MGRHPRSTLACAAILGAWLGQPEIAFAATPTTPTEEGGAVSLAARKELVQLLQTDQFAELDRRLRAYQQRYEAAEGDELEVAQAFAAFATSDPALEPHLDRFVAAQPGWPARLARAQWRLRRAELERGTRWAKDTSDSQFAGLERWLTLASEDLGVALQDGPRVQATYSTTLDVLRHGAPRAVREQILARALAADPSAYLVRRTYLALLTPRWGGSFQEMESFVAEADARAAANPRLRLLRGKIHRERASQLSQSHQEDAALAEYTRAVDLGPAEFALRDRAELLLARGLAGEALSDLNRAIALDPGVTGSYALRARAHAALGRRDRALNDLDRALELDPLEPEARDARASVRIELSDWAGAEDDLSLATRYEPRSARTWLRLAWVQARRGRDLAAAEESVARAVALAPGDDEARQLLADVRRRRAAAVPPASRQP
ncbi:MAG TPA: DUF4034 domain-containing protein [Myxococcota bacterium]|nr:DUF4034 domain-containing protein [Myxococcota bacterium]